PGPTGWAWVGEDGRWAAGSVLEGTNNVGELLAVLYAISDHATVAELTIVADSKYAIHSYCTWIDAHERRGWTTSTGAPTKN
ncbi:ribonuclease HI, partial [Klebsiella pneumoniae]|uniref:RNase H family protein n=1 Tax=Klebsiella pneumoniae TaxID=573 RepID=UPI00190678C2